MRCSNAAQGVLNLQQVSQAARQHDREILAPPRMPVPENGNPFRLFGMVARNGETFNLIWDDPEQITSPSRASPSLDGNDPTISAANLNPMIVTTPPPGIDEYSALAA